MVDNKKIFEVSSELLDDDNNELIMKANLIKIRTKSSSVVTIPNADVIMISLDDQNTLDVAEFLELEEFIIKQCTNCICMFILCDSI